MAKSQVYFTNLRTNPHSNLLDKLERLCKRAGMEDMPLKGAFAAIKIHFGEPGNLAYIRPNFAARIASMLKEAGAKPFLTDSNTLYSDAATMLSIICRAPLRTDSTLYREAATLSSPMA